MSYQLVEQVRDHSKTKGEERCVLFALATRADANGLAFPSLDLLEKEANVSRRQIQRYIAVRWVTSPEIYVGRGHGRGNSHHYTLLCGCDDQEAVRRLMVNYQMTEAEALAIWQSKKGDIQVQKVTSETPFTVGEKGDICAEKVTSEYLKGDILDAKGDSVCHPNLHIESSNLESSDLNRHSSSSPTPPAVEEKEISKGLTTLLIEAFAELCKWRASNPKVASYLDQIRATDPEVAPADFRAFKMYYEAVRGKDDKYEHPYPLFVADGWGRFTEWWKAHRDDGVFGHLPGVDDTFNLARWVWVSLEDWPAGEGVLSPRRGGMVFYAKQPDGSFREVPREQWPEWAREQVAERESA